VAPVTSRIADADEYRLLFGTRPLEGFRPPSIPVHGVVGVLEEIRGCFVLEVVHFLFLTAKPKNRKI
jgi:hypothetical protein